MLEKTAQVLTDNRREALAMVDELEDLDIIKSLKEYKGSEIVLPELFPNSAPTGIPSMSEYAMAKKEQDNGS